MTKIILLVMMIGSLAGCSLIDFNIVRSILKDCSDYNLSNNQCLISKCQTTDDKIIFILSQSEGDEDSSSILYDIKGKRIGSEHYGLYSKPQSTKDHNISYTCTNDTLYPKSK